MGMMESFRGCAEELDAAASRGGSKSVWQSWRRGANGQATACDAPRNGPLRCSDFHRAHGKPFVDEITVHPCDFHSRRGNLPVAGESVSQKSNASGGKLSIAVFGVTGGSSNEGEI